MSQTPRLNINLASERFRTDRAILVASAIVSVALVVLLGFLSAAIHRQRDAARESRAHIAVLQQRLRGVQAEEAKLRGELRQPANESILDRSQFINTLLQRKGISWTRMFGDLQEVMPPTVCLVSVRPFATGDNRIQLDMVVGSKAPAAVIDLLKRLEDSPLFGGTSVQGEQPPSQNEPLFRYRVTVNYAQKL